jgi:nucleoid-associated protein YgaU
MTDRLDPWPSTDYYIPMEYLRWVRSWSCPLLAGLLCCLLTVACQKDAARLDRSDEDHPLMRKAAAKKASGEFDEAIRLFREALEADTRLARAHLELALLYETKKEDYIRAIYHYKYYLEARPTTDKRQLLEDSIRHAEQKYLTTFPLRPFVETEIKQLREENKQLRKRNIELNQALRDLKISVNNLRISSGLTEKSTGNTGESGGAARGVTTYRVQAGDTLMKIAERVYGDQAGWVKIQAANRQKLPDTNKMKVGMDLVIPR